MSDRLFRDRRDAGQVLAGLLEHCRDGDDLVILGLPRGGVPVAYEVATALHAPLDVFVVRKLGAPRQPELAMGAIASGGVVVLNDDVVRALGVGSEDIQRVAEEEGRELQRRERAYRDGRPMIDVEGKVAVLVDDGLATGASMRAAIEALRRLRPLQIVAAIPAAPASTCQELTDEVDEVVCATTPTPFFAVGSSYWDFSQTTDDEVRHLLLEAAETHQTQRVTTGPGHTDADVVRSAAIPVRDGVPSDDALFDLVGDARLVLLGEATHGTREFYAARARMTRRLIEERGFCAVAAEADWPDAYRVNRYVHGRGYDTSAEQALGGFERFPTWMWRNAEVLDFVGWLREHNATVDERANASFYGIDLYSLHRSATEVIAYLDSVDRAAAARARERYACFDHHDEGQEYGFAAAFGAGEPCEKQAVAQLVELQRNALDYVRGNAPGDDRAGSGAASGGGPVHEDELFYAEQNARTVQAAERYYRTMFSGRVSSWNLRDKHMVDALDALVEHLGRRREEPAKVVVWAHNSHLGDARATELAATGEFNVGQLVRERHPDDCRLIGFTTYTGTVTAADDWGGAPKRKIVRPALPGSIEALFHEVGLDEFMLSFGATPRAADALRSARLERAIGVVYRPQTERRSHYFNARLADQFDAVIHVDETGALEPLERMAQWDSGEPPETYPFAV